MTLKKTTCSDTAISLAVIRTTVLPLCLLMFVTAMPAAAQQLPADAAPAVPDNIAPHPAPVQPLPMSHKTHLASGLVCLNCHANSEPGALMTFPTTEACMMCHRTIATDKAPIKSLLEFAETGQPIPWVRVYAITPGVTWSHRAHLDADVRCDTCHGDISQVETVAETKATLAMATCISCHEARNAATECVACHAWPTDQDLGFE